MIRTVEAIIDEDGNVELLEHIQLRTRQRALVTILDEAPATAVGDVTLLSEAALAEDWDRPEEDAAWKCLQPEP